MTIHPPPSHPCARPRTSARAKAERALFAVLLLAVGVMPVGATPLAPAPHSPPRPAPGDAHLAAQDNDQPDPAGATDEGAIANADPRLVRYVDRLAASSERLLRFAFDKIRAAGRDGVPVLLARYADTTDTGRVLTLILLTDHKTDEILGHALSVVVDPAARPLARWVAARIVDRFESDELVARVETEIATAAPFARDQYLDLLSRMPVDLAYPLLMEAAPDAAGREDPDALSVVEEVDLLRWRALVLRAAIDNPVGATRWIQAAVRANRAPGPRALLRVFDMLDRYREVSGTLRFVASREYETRRLAEMTLTTLCRAVPTMAHVFAGHDDYRVRTRAVELLARQRGGTALAGLLEMINDVDANIGSRALKALAQLGPVSTEALGHLADRAPANVADLLRGLTERMPDSENLRRFRDQQDQLRRIYPAMLFEFGPTHPRVARLAMSWGQMVGQWEWIASWWSAEWLRLGPQLRPEPRGRLVESLLDNLP